jgi:EAL domain-containing protein (putative c-di-GMP-specific phosphodiesterase class I)/GGDEF domain-containing protein
MDVKYDNFLTSRECGEILQKYLKDKEPDIIKTFGKTCAKNKIPYLEVLFFIEDFSKKQNVFIDVNYLAKGYIEEKLQIDKKLFENELKKNLLDKKILNFHIEWIIKFINAIKENSALPEMDKKKCKVGKWLKENYNREIAAIHHSIHELATFAYQFYQKKEFHRFLLVYIDIVHFSLLLRESILQYFTSEILVSLTVDALTKLPNRFALLNDIKNLNEDTTFFLFNIKDFGKINLLFGQETGDKVLESVADLINKLPVKKAYRIYGDEFGILIDNKNAYKKIKKIIETVESHSYPDSKLVTISIYGAYAKISENLLGKVEFGAIKAKKELKKVINVDNLSKEEIKNHAKNLELSQRLKLAFADNRLYLYYQPIFNLRTLKIEKYECLLRFEDIDGKIHSPGEFLDVLKNMYIYPEITKAVIFEAFEKFKNMPYEFSVNLSFRDIVNEKTAKSILGILERYSDVSKRAVFELLEYEAVLNFDKVLNFFSLAKQKGVKIALDDFGAGYSNFIYLFKFDVDYIKIDGSLTQNILLDEKVKILISSIINIAKEIGAKTIAEFVSTKEIFEAVKMLGVDFVQGYYIGKPKKEL